MWWHRHAVGRIANPSYPIGFVLACFAVLAWAGETIAAEPIKKSTGTFTVAGKTINVEHFEPKAPGTYPAVLMLHGSEGLDKRWGFIYRGGAETRPLFRPHGHQPNRP